MWKYSCWRQFQLIVRYFKVKVNYGYFKIHFNKFENILTRGRECYHFNCTPVFEYSKCQPINHWLWFHTWNQRPKSKTRNGIKWNRETLWRNLISDFLNKSYVIFFFNANVFPRKDFFLNSIKGDHHGKKFRGKIMQ